MKAQSGDCSTGFVNRATVLLPLCSITPAKYSNKYRGSFRRLNVEKRLNIEMRKAFQRRDLDVIFDLDPGDEYPEKVSSLLHGLCDTLDGRVNPDLPHLHQVQGVKYPNLDALLRRLRSRRFGKKVCTRLYEQKRACLFTVLAGKDTDETQKPLAEFNSFVDGCKLSGASLDELAHISSKGTRFNAQVFRSPFRCLAIAALREIFFSFSNCIHHHEILLQLPRWDKIASDDTSNASLTLELFLASCSVSTWQRSANSDKTVSKIGRGTKAIVTSVLQGHA